MNKDLKLFQDYLLEQEPVRCSCGKFDTQNAPQKYVPADVDGVSAIKIKKLCDRPHNLNKSDLKAIENMLNDLALQIHLLYKPEEP